MIISPYNPVLLCAKIK